jgi:hypothetical protein
MSRLVGVRSVQRSLLPCDARLNSLSLMSTCWTVSSEGVTAGLPLVFNESDVLWERDNWFIFHLADFG